MAEAPTIAFSNLNIAQSPYALRSLEWLGDFVRGAGFDGVEYTPIYDIVRHTPAAIGKAVASDELAIISLHAPFRESPRARALARAAEVDSGGDDSKRRGLTERVVNSAAGRLVMPDVFEAVPVLAAIQGYIGARPSVLYPFVDPRLDRAQVNGVKAKEVLFQPQDALAQDMGTANIHDFHTMMMGRGYNYVCDTVHLRQREVSEKRGIVSDIASSLPIIVAHAPAVHLALNRLDIADQSHIPTHLEAVDAIDGRYRGELSAIMGSLKEGGTVRQVTIELTLQGLRAATNYQKMPDLQKAYAAIAAGVRDYWNMPS